MKNLENGKHEGKMIDHKSVLCKEDMSNIKNILFHPKIKLDKRKFLKEAVYVPVFRLTYKKAGTKAETQFFTGNEFQGFFEQLDFEIILDQERDFRDKGKTAYISRYIISANFIDVTFMSRKSSNLIYKGSMDENPNYFKEDAMSPQEFVKE